MLRRRHIIDEKSRRAKFKYYLLQSAVAGLVFYIMLEFQYRIGGYVFLAAAAAGTAMAAVMSKNWNRQPALAVFFFPLFLSIVRRLFRNILKDLA